MYVVAYFQTLSCDSFLVVTAFLTFYLQQARNVPLPFGTFEQYFAAYTQILNKFGEFKNWTNQEIDEKSKYLLAKTKQIPPIFTSGFYAIHLHRWLMYFNRSNLMIIDGEEMFKDPGPVIENVQNFLKIPRLLLRNDYVKDPKTGFYCVKNFGKNNTLQCLPLAKQRTRNKKNLLLPHVKKKLDSIYASHNEGFFKMIGERFDW